MSTGRHLPQHLGHHLLADGRDSLGRHIDGNVVIIEPVYITDPVHLPLGGPAEPGLWGIALWVEDPGGDPLRLVGANDEAPLVLDPPAGDVEPDLGDLFHVDVQYTELLQSAAA